jgi:hypothetical protein
MPNPTLRNMRSAPLAPAARPVRSVAPTPRPPGRARRALALWTLLVACASARSDVVLDWNAVMLNAIRGDNTGPTLSTRNLAILNTAMFDAVNSVTRGHQPYRFLLPTPEACSAEAAAMAAGHKVTKTLYQGAAARAEKLYSEYLERTEPGEARANGLALGAEIARRMLDSRAADGSQTEVPYIPSNAPGQWRRTPPFFRPPLTPHWRHVTPFGIPNVASFMPPPPPPLDSPEYAASLNGVKEIGSASSAIRTPEQSQIAAFWSDFSYTAMPPGHWHEIAADIARERGNTLEQNARMMALLSVAQADGAIVCWEAKYLYNTWRPVTAIQRADEDNNPLTEADPKWQQFLPSPPFPAYPSGHSTFSSASAAVLAHFFGTDAITFTARSDTLPGVTRVFHSLKQCAEEVGMSRIYGGFHYLFDAQGGAICGERIGEFIAANLLIPIEQLPLARVEEILDGIPRIRVHGRVGRECVLEVSSDMTDWIPVSTMAAEPGGAVVSVPELGRTAQYFRAREL